MTTPHASTTPPTPTAPVAPITQLVFFDDASWAAGDGAAVTSQVERVVERGDMLSFPKLHFELSAAERALLDPRVGDTKAKNIALRGDATELRGTSLVGDELRVLTAMVTRYREHATQLVERLFPHYRGRVRAENTSFRPYAVEGRQTSWRQDDSRLHVDAFPSNPSHGERLLRVFHNLNPHGQPRVWRVGERFEDFARRHVDRIRPPLPGSAALLHWLHVTKRRRSAYDHYMLQLHDRAKADVEWQQSGPSRTVAFEPGTTWVVFSDQVLHAVMSGQFMLEQTFKLRSTDMLHPELAPLAVLERMTGRGLIERERG